MFVKWINYFATCHVWNGHFFSLKNQSFLSNLRRAIILAKPKKDTILKRINFNDMCGKRVKLGVSQISLIIAPHYFR